MAKRTAEDASRSTSAASQTEEGQERQVKKRRTDGSVASPAKKATAAPRQTKKTKGATPDVGPKREPQPKRLDKGKILHEHCALAAVASATPLRQPLSIN